MSRYLLSAACLFPLAAIAADTAAAQNVNPYSPPIANDAPNCRNGVSGAILRPDGSIEQLIFEPGSTRCGLGSVANVPGATAVGADAVADGTEATALGHQAWARAPRSTALGSNATATHAGSTAIGANARTTAPNQVTLGAAGTSVRVGDIAASTAAQVGPVALVTVDAGGTLGRDTTTLPAIQTLIQTTASAQGARLSALEAQDAVLASSVDSLFDLRQLDRRDMQQGIAAAVAMGQPHMPSAPGRTSYVLNVSTFRGEQAIGGALMHRLRSGAPLAISAGFSYAGNRNNAARVGIAGEF